MHTGCCGITRNKKNYENLYTVGRIILKWITNKKHGRAQTGFTWLKKGISGRLKKVKSLFTGLFQHSDLLGQ
jgi:hypothetical protein